MNELYKEFILYLGYHLFLSLDVPLGILFCNETFRKVIIILKLFLDIHGIV